MGFPHRDASAGSSLSRAPGVLPLVHLLAATWLVTPGSPTGEAWSGGPLPAGPRAELEPPVQGSRESEGCLGAAGG